MGLIALGGRGGYPARHRCRTAAHLGHGLTKSVLFLTSGEILTPEGTSRIDGVGAWSTPARPRWIFGFGLVALLGLPPFSLFASELLMVRAEFEVGLGWAAVGGHGGDGGRVYRRGRACPAHALRAGRSTSPGRIVRGVTAPLPRWVVAPLIGGLVVCGFIGVFAWPLSGLLAAAGAVRGRCDGSLSLQRCRSSWSVGTAGPE